MCERAAKCVATLLAGCLVVGLPTIGCTGELFKNQTEPTAGNITFRFVNNTDYRASFSFGTWDSLDRSPGPASLEQLRLEGNSVSDPVSVTCRRNAAVGTEEFRLRVLNTGENETGDFDADAFDSTVHFSDAPADSDLAAVATVGTAQGIERLVGVDFTCGDELIFTFVEDPDASGGFRIDFSVFVEEDDLE